jgi:hypothetical protein
VSTYIVNPLFISPKATKFEKRALLKQRKELSNNNPSFPPLEDISKWAEKYNLYEDLLKFLFGLVENDDHFRP